MEDSTKSGETSADDAKVKSELNLVEKLRVELQVKDEELAKEKQEKQVCKAFYYLQIYARMPLVFSQKLSADLELEKAGANTQANQVTKLETELAGAQQIIVDLQLNLW
jgi:hypothetical protein